MVVRCSPMWSDLLRREVCRRCYQTLDHGLDLNLQTESAPDCDCSLHRSGWAIVVHLVCAHCGQCFDHGAAVQLVYGLRGFN